MVTNAQPFSRPKESVKAKQTLLYVSDGITSGGYITYYAYGAQGDTSPLGSIAGSNTQLNQPLGLTMDSRGEL